MLDTQAIMDYRRELGDWDEPECSHPVADRWPFKHDWEICGICGAIVRPADFIPFLAEHLLEVCYDAR